MDIKQHAATVAAAVNAINAYAEWAPLPDLVKYGIIYGKRPVDDASEYDSAMRNVFEILMNVTRDLLYKSISNASISESEFELAEYICESLVSLGSTNLQCISADSTVFSFYLQQMLGFFQSSKLALHYQSLLFWLSLMRYLMSKSKAALADDSNMGTRQADIEKSKIIALVTDEISSGLLDASFQRMLKKEQVHSGMAPTVGNFELWSDDFDSKIDFSQYRSRLLELIRFIASDKPLLAAAKVSEKVTEEDLAMIESMFASTAYFIEMIEPTLVEILGHYLDAMGPFLRYNPDAVGRDPLTITCSSCKTADNLHLSFDSLRLLVKASLPHMKVFSVFLVQFAKIRVFTMKSISMSKIFFNVGVTGVWPISVVSTVVHKMI
ncbi:protein hasty 1 [Phtheirospermum japonicum]|uniref:Protein hasty 1 n=1 Tax=Phtheirospermum japonicum TaxID=374723 RepID=A0A830D9S7_9LAMI|nr:protein hasty 1 [Phtheirospermum japonicum]